MEHEKTEITKELKALGAELTKAFKQIRSSREFKDLEKELKAAVKGVSSALVSGLKAAKNSEEADELKKRLGRVVKAGTAQSKVEAAKARRAAAEGLKKIRAAVRKMGKRAKKTE